MHLHTFHYLLVINYFHFFHKKIIITIVLRYFSFFTWFIDLTGLIRVELFFFLMYKYSWIIQLLLKIKFLKLTSKNIFSNFTFKNIIKWFNYSEFFHLFTKIVFIIIKLSKSKLAKNFIFFVFGRCMAAMTEQFFNGEFFFFFHSLFPL